MALEYELQGFDELRQLIQVHTPHLRAHHTLLKVFHRCSSVVIILPALGCVFLAGMAWLGIYQRQFWFLWFVAGFGLCTLIARLREIQRVHVDPQGVTLVSLLWNRFIPYEMIADISLKNGSWYESTYAMVFLNLKDRRRVRLFKFTEGAIALHDSLHSTWKGAQG